VGVLAWLIGLVAMMLAVACGPVFTLQRACLTVRVMRCRYGWPRGWPSRSCLAAVMARPSPGRGGPLTLIGVASVCWPRCARRSASRATPALRSHTVVRFTLDRLAMYRFANSNAAYGLSRETGRALRWVWAARVVFTAFIALTTQFQAVHA